MRIVPPLVLMALVALAPLVTAATVAPVEPVFGAGEAAFREYEIDGVNNAPEPTIGIPWTTDSVFYHSGATTMRGTFADDGSVEWVDVTPPYQVPTNLDPMLVADEDTGRVLAGGLLGACSVMMLSDDDGETWIPAGNMCSGAQFDHQSVGIGPKPGLGNPDNVPNLQNAYYCGQLGQIGCAVSYDGGESWSVPTPHVGACGGFHGHWRVSRVTGTAFLPVGACGEEHGMLVAGATGGLLSAPTGIIFEERFVAGSHTWDGGFDPSIGISRDSGWLYYGMADDAGARLGLSKDEAVSWEEIGGGMGVTPTTWLDVGAFHDPPVVKATFADVQAGDDDRVAFTFLGLEDLDGDGLGDEYEDLYSCDEPEGGENREWHYYAAFSFDAGDTWNVTRITEHPVQVGGIWDGGGGNPCRNLLDFNDMDIDSTGRVHIAWADGCLDDCRNATEGGRYSQAARLFRQVGGPGLFAEYDTEAPAVPTGGADQEQDETGSTPAPSLVVATLAVVGLALAARRRR